MRAPALMVAVLSLWVGVPAGAQSAAPWVERLPPKIPDATHLTLARYREFIDCQANSEWGNVAPLFDTRTGSRDEADTLTKISGGDYGNRCSNALRMRMTSVLMRGGLAEARYRYLTRSDPPPAVMNNDLASVPEGASFRWVEFFKESPAQRQLEFATCLAYQEPGLVNAVLVTRMGSKGEREALQQLSRRFGKCMRAGEELRANTLTLRPWLGEAAFQRLRKTGNAQ